MFVPTGSGLSEGGISARQFAPTDERSCPEEWYILHSLNIEFHVNLVHGETDFLILAPRLGIFALEVKGGSVKRLNGEWIFTDRHGHSSTKHRGPFEQAADGIHSIMRFISANVDASHSHLKNMFFLYF